MKYKIYPTIFPPKIGESRFWNLPRHSVAAVEIRRNGNCPLSLCLN